MEIDFSSGDNIYEVERILKKRRHPSKGVEYFVKWKHFPNSANTWEPACNFPEKLIKDYELSHSKKKKKVTSQSSESSSKTTSTGVVATTSSLERDDIEEVSKVQPRKNSKQHRQQQFQLQQNIQKQQLAVFNPVGTHSLPIVEEVVYEPELTKEPIIVTDVTAKDVTVTISECKTPGNFFSM